jgi:hypothetical protein
MLLNIWFFFVVGWMVCYAFEVVVYWLVVDTCFFVGIDNYLSIDYPILCNIFVFRPSTGLVIIDGGWSIILIHQCVPFC